MKAFGYQKDREDLLELEETTLSLTLEELDKLIKFLQNVKQEHSKVAEKKLAYYCHSHYRDWDKEWNRDSTDFIIVNSVE